MATDEAHPHPGPDYRFLLANERTFLAYVRTALSLQVAGLAVLQFFTGGHAAVRIGLGIALVAAGSFAGVAGWLRFRHNDRRIRAGLPLPSPHASLAVVTVVAAVPLVAAVFLTLG
jgi:putative membrane protein